jgi:hypothetical protein
MSDVEKFYSAVTAKFGINVAWHQLHPMQQMQFVEGINQIMFVLSQIQPQNQQ